MKFQLRENDEASPWRYLHLRVSKVRHYLDPAHCASPSRFEIEPRVVMMKTPSLHSSNFLTGQRVEWARRMKRPIFHLDNPMLAILTWSEVDSGLTSAGRAEYDSTTTETRENKQTPAEIGETASYSYDRNVSAMCHVSPMIEFIGAAYCEGLKSPRVLKVRQKSSIVVQDTTNIFRATCPIITFPKAESQSTSTLCEIRKTALSGGLSLITAGVIVIFQLLSSSPKFHLFRFWERRFRYILRLIHG